MKATKYREGQRSITVGADVGGNWGGLAKRLMRSSRVEIALVLREDGPKVGLAMYDHVVETLSACAAKKSLRRRRLSPSTWRNGASQGSSCFSNPV